ncbi:hypothetical protein Cci01nite_18000 [Catellatospora citrea]|uniref:Uncharacterized protein n=1 Tax=Catellatospora citrea TaxID=53366 RepID=A0A8J3KB57_9ACTN|nr:hypothetical protein Cci01nite_18000 [Catellatospora citrea]
MPATSTDSRQAVAIARCRPLMCAYPAPSQSAIYAPGHVGGVLVADRGWAFRAAHVSGETGLQKTLEGST